MECTKSEDNIWLLNSVVFFLVDVLFSGHSWCYCTPCEFPKAMLTDASFLWNLLPAFVLIFERWCWWVELGRDSHFQFAEKLSNVGSVDLRSRLLRYKYHSFSGWYLQFLKTFLYCLLNLILLLLLSVGDFCRYASIKAIESPFKEDDQLWLTYWVLYSFVTLLELVAAPVIAW
jgi:hypothetical protein